jgi:hypothetical protein
LRFWASLSLYDTNVQSGTHLATISLFWTALFII